MDDEAKSTKPKPFVFVLMPFDSTFDDIYKFGIKGAAEEAGAYAERLDEQIFTEGILERVFNQISKADVVVADMTGRNANVFYEVGYAHALNKIVLLLTQNADDIPFDLKHHQHTVYEGKIDTLRKELTAKIAWAINEARTYQRGRTPEPFELTINEIAVSTHSTSAEAPAVMTIVDGPIQEVSVIVRNNSLEPSDPISHIYLFSGEGSAFAFFRIFQRGRYLLQSVRAHNSDYADGFCKLFQTFERISSLPPETFETFTFGIRLNHAEVKEGAEALKLRLHTSNRSYSYMFKIAFQKKGKV